MEEIALLSLTAALNPSLLAATTVILLLPKPGRLMLGYWLGAMLTSVSLGLVIVFSLANSSFDKTARGKISPAIELAIAGLVLLIALVPASGRDEPVERGHAEHKRENKPPKW